MHFRFGHRAILGFLILTNGLGVGLVLSNPDFSQLWEQRARVFAAYENRISQLDSAVELLRSREILNAGTSATRALEIAELQQEVEAQLGPLVDLVSSMADLGIVSADIPDMIPRANVDTGSNIADQLSVLESELEAMEYELAAAVEALPGAISRSADTIMTELGRIGYAPETAGYAQGGPFLAVVDPTVNTNTLIGQAAEALDLFREARDAMDDVPIHHPLSTSQISSNFGTRKDPFTGQTAFHTGIDFPAPSGAPVRSAGRGVVIFVGWKGAYGNVVEIRHPSGLVSRYPHLSRALVKEGDRVEAHTQIALVGSTGRSTGPHLHFELRDQSGAIDPAPYLAAGERLRPFDT